MQNKAVNEKHKRKSKMSDINPPIAIMALNINGLNNQIKKQRLSDWIKKNNMAQLYAVYGRCNLVIPSVE